MWAGTSVRRRVSYIVAAAMLVGIAAACAPPPPSDGGPSTSFVGALYSQMNADRAANGLPALAWRSQLAGAAQNWSANMASTGSLTHQDLDALLASLAGYWTVGEDLYMGPPGTGPEQVEGAWMSSPLHRANILSGNFNTVGIGVTVSADGRVWATADFGGSG